MSDNRKRREPKAPLLFRVLWPKRSLGIEQRRFAGLENRQGFEPPGEAVTLESKVIYYTNRESRETHWVSVSELEAKPAADDWSLKISGMVLFAVTFFMSILCVGTDEIKAVLFPTAGAYRPGNIVSTAVILILLYFILFAWMYNKFTKMDHTWRNCVDNFFANGARPQMDAVRNCMREFKRFVKWRRFMRLNMWTAGIVMFVEVVLLVFSDDIGRMAGLSLKWSHAELWFSAGFLTLQVCWFAVYWWMWVYFTTFRDPTLQICVMINVMDRANVATAYTADRNRR
jgi:hypothetical protein